LGTLNSINLAQWAARALANEPAIILADEPTGNLDVTNKQEIVKLLADLNQKQGTTIIMVTHDEQVAAHTQRMLYLSDGKINEDKQAQKEALFSSQSKSKEAYGE
jgi:putative ABC transport system ATP-binding protein